ncbi:hypothetical protein LBMAG52_04970 [Planctomycetia bacterium]|nr:hypothetical protein LBMAG52_04970 [Planctomycetia bacterium]
MQLVIDPAGDVRCLYDEALPLAEFGRLTIARGSHVEPTAVGLWTAELSPVGGPLLGPFATRSAALIAEREWLEAHWLATEEARIEHGPGDALPLVLRV